MSTKFSRNSSRVQPTPKICISKQKPPPPIAGLAYPVRVAVTAYGVHPEAGSWSTSGNHQPLIPNPLAPYYVTWSTANWTWQWWLWWWTPSTTCQYFLRALWTPTGVGQGMYSQPHTILSHFPWDSGTMIDETNGPHPINATCRATG